jgi:hypothetical protein
VPLLAVAVVLIGLLSAVDLLRTVTRARGVRAYADKPADQAQTAPAGAPQPIATTLRRVAGVRGQSARSDVIDSAA